MASIVRSTKIKQSASWPVQMDIDMGQLVSTMRFISAINDEIVVNKETRDRIASIIIHRQMSEFIDSAKKRSYDQKKDSIAHVFKWEDIVEHSGFHKVSIDEDSPLFKIIKNPRRSGNIFSIVFVDNNDNALRDSKLESIATNKLTEHHFKDQASNLERVSVIEKRSSVLSKRRISGTEASSGKNQLSRRGMKFEKLRRRRIIELDSSRSKIVSRQDVRRPNRFQNNFTKFFFEFFSYDESIGPANMRTAKKLSLGISSLHSNLMAVQAMARKDASFSSARRAGGATKVTARYSGSAVIAIDDKGKIIGPSGFDFTSRPQDRQKIKNLINSITTPTSDTQALRTLS